MLNHADYVQSLKIAFDAVAVNDAFMAITKHRESTSGDWPYPTSVIMALCEAIRELPDDNYECDKVKVLGRYIEERL